jgi:PAS domain S-box-containing protein
MDLAEKDINSLQEELARVQRALDVSKQQNQDLRDKTNFHLKELFDLSNDLIQIFSPNGEFRFVNEAWRNKLGYREDEVDQLKFVEVIHPDHRKSTLENLLKITAGSKLERFETVLTTKTGKNIYVIGKLNSIFENDAPVEFRCVFFDITERFRAERAQSLYYKIANIAITQSNPAEFYEQVFSELNEILRVHNMSICLKENKQNKLLYQIDNSAISTATKPDMIQDMLVDYTFERAKPLIIYRDGIEKIGNQKKVRLIGKLPSIWLGVLIRIDNNDAGVFSIWSYEDQSSYNHKDLELLDFIAGQIAIILERQKNADKIQNQGARINAIFESSTHQIWSLNQQFAFTSFNKNYALSFENYYGFKPEFGMSQLEVDSKSVNGKSIVFWEKKYQSAFQGNAIHFEISQKNTNGEQVWRDIYLNPIYSKSGEVVEISSISNDITEKKQSDISLKESEAKFRTIFESFQDIYFRCDMEGYVSMVSPSVEKVLGYTQREILGKSINKFFISKSKMAFLLRSLHKDNQVSNFESTVTTKSGKKVQVLSNVRLIKKNKNKFEIEGVARDFTRIKETNLQLKEAKEVAERSLKIREQFLANMSHEIRTPMNGIIGMIDLIGSTKLNKEQADYIRTIKKSSDNLLDILNDILDLSKIEAGKMELRMGAVKLFDTFKKIYDLYSQQAHLSGNTLFYHLDEKLPEYVIADETRLIQVLSNLTSNAIKFSPKKGNINISLRVVKQKNDLFTFKVSIKDSGIGIQQNDIFKLFKSFSQIDSSISKNYSGSGLGLVISKELVKSMGGEIGVASTPGLGSTFWFTFQALATDPPTTETKEESGFVKQFKEDIPHILLVDDNHINRNVAKSILKKSGCRVIEAASGKEAIAKVKKHKFDLIFMDVQMPDMDGIEATNIIKSLGIKNLSPIVAMTAYSMEEDRANFLSKGMDDYMPKPIKAKSLIDTVKKWIHFEAKTVNAEVFNESTEELIINQNTLNHLHKYGGEELIKSVLSDFEIEASNQVANIVKWNKLGEYDLMLKELHTLKGNAGTLGIERLCAQSRNLESKLKQNDFQNLDKEVKMISKSFADFKYNYKSFIATL